jgi:hypothetical protein
LPAAAGYVCEYAAYPGYKWSSPTDDTGAFGGAVSCSKLETPLPGGTARQFYNWQQIAKLILEL